MKSKGQILVFEQVLLFSLGIAILIISFSLFILYQNYYLSETTQDQITQVKEYVLSSILRLCEKRDFNSSLVLSVPKMIGNSFYRISLSNTGLTLSLEVEGAEGEVSDFSKLYGFNETFDFSGMVISDQGKVVIYKIGNSIIIQ